MSDAINDKWTCMRYCSNCGKELQDDMQFCPSCGTPVQMTAEEPRMNEAVFIEDTVPKKKQIKLWKCLETHISMERELRFQNLMNLELIKRMILPFTILDL